jgi:CRP-like cAMP-binding protein
VRHGFTPDHGYRERMRAIPLFAGLDDREIDVLDATVSEVTVAAGRRLTVEGEVGREFAVILDGLASVVRGGVEVERLGPSGFFGEHALLHGARRTADVVALTPMRLLVAGPSEFDRMVREIDTFAERVADTDRRRQQSPAGSVGD